MHLTYKHLNDRAASLQEKYSPHTLKIISCMILVSSLRHLHRYTYMLIHMLLGKLATVLMMIIMLQDYLHLFIQENWPRIGQTEMIRKISITLELVPSIRMNRPNIGSYFICSKNIPSWHWAALANMSSQLHCHSSRATSFFFFSSATILLLNMCFWRYGKPTVQYRRLTLCVLHSVFSLRCALAIVRCLQKWRQGEINYSWRTC